MNQTLICARMGLSGGKWCSNTSVIEGQTVQFEREQRDKFWNGKNLHPVIVSPSLLSNGVVVNVTKQIIASGSTHSENQSHPPLHELSAEELRKLYKKVEADHGEAVLLGHISIRSAMLKLLPC